MSRTRVLLRGRGVCFRASARLKVTNTSVCIKMCEYEYMRVKGYAAPASTGYCPVNSYSAVAASIAAYASVLVLKPVFSMYLHVTFFDRWPFLRL